MTNEPNNPTHFRLREGFKVIKKVFNHRCVCGINIHKERGKKKPLFFVTVKDLSVG